jgi:endo-1,4-beta-mannosidase
MKIKGSILSIVFLLVLTSPEAQQTTRPAKYTVSAAAPGKIWSVAKATAWYKQYRWITGANFIPSTAINQLEMWQADSFDPVTIDRELSWAESIGFNTMRVFLHSLAWKQDREGFKKRVDQYLAIASKHNIQTMFVFFDDCWNKVPQAGKQPEPKAGIHNSGWMQDPGYPLSFDSTYFPQLQKYVVDVMTRFKHDKRILLWDLYNEPGNSNKRDSSLPLLTKVFQWARSVNPDQPISSGVWDWSFEKLNQFQIANSDVVTYHDYEEPQWHARVIQLLKTHGRPLICTEYMARVRKSTFANTLPLLKK